MPDDKVILRAEKIRKVFPTAERPLPVLRGVNLDVREGEIIAIVGASGAGKSTLLHILGILDAPTSGAVSYDGEDLNALSAREQAVYRNRLFGFVFQFYHLLPDFDAAENVLMPALIGRSLSRDHGTKQEARQKAADILERVGLGDRLRHRPSQLSGGERQRVAIARALVNDPKILLCDEPTGNLDSKTGTEIRDLIWDLNRTRRQTVVLATHDESLASDAMRMVRILDGKIVA